jgi:hypothetical protein
MSNIFTQAALARITNCSRANISKLTKQNPPVLIPEPDGKINIDNEINRVWYDTRMVRIGKDPQEKQANAEKKDNPKKTRVKKQKKTNSEKPNNLENAPKTETTIEAETDQIPGNEETNIFPENKDDEKKEDKKEPLAVKKQRLEIEKLQEQRDNLRIKNQRERAQLVDRDPFADTIFAYLAALNKNIMEMPVSYLDKVENAIELKKSRSETASIITQAICAEIKKTKERIEAEIRRYEREIKSDSKKSDEGDE